MITKMDSPIQLAIYVSSLYKLYRRWTAVLANTFKVRMDSHFEMDSQIKLYIILLNDKTVQSSLNNSVIATSRDGQPERKMDGPIWTWRWLEISVGNKLVITNFGDGRLG